MIGLEAKISRAKKKSNDEKKLNARLAEELRAKEDKVRLLVGRQSMVQRFRTSYILNMCCSFLSLFTCLRE